MTQVGATIASLLRLPALKADQWSHVIKRTVTITILIDILAVTGSVLTDLAIQGKVSVAMDVIFPIILATFLAAPVTAFLSIKNRQLEDANAQLERHATTDDLTGTLNRAAFTRRLEQSLPKSDTSCLLIIDVDKFKDVNDLFGHAQGDLALQTISEAMRSALRPDDLIARLGGEEFGIYLPNCPLTEGLRIGERIRQAVLSAPFSPDGTDYQLSVSIGMTIGDTATNFQQMYKSADILLYSAKRNGRNRIMHELDNKSDNAPQVKSARA